MKVVILCGGQGTRLQEATRGLIPKPMVEVGGRPLLWHIMQGFAHQGFNEFVLCLGHLGNVIREYFLNLEAMSCDVTLKLGRPGEIVFHDGGRKLDWTITLAETGATTMTGARLVRARRHIGDGPFLMTYGDGVADVDLQALVAFHRAHGRVGTVTGVRPVGRFGLLGVEQGQVRSFREKDVGDERINGGFFVFEPAIFDRLSADPSCMLEFEPLGRLAEDGGLMMYAHDGFWRCVDTLRDLQVLEELWVGGQPPWRTWRED